MNKLITVVSLAILAVTQPALAGQDVGAPVGTTVGRSVGSLVGADLSAAVGAALPTGIGGVAAIAALSLVVGIQLIKRRKK
jgi:hypothetical protein